MKPPVLAVSRGRLPGQLVSDLDGRVELREWTSSGAPDADELAEFCADADALVCRSTDIIDDALLVRTPRLRVVARAGAGYENFDLAAMSRRSVVGCITPDVVTEATADLTWALILASCRRVVEAASWLKDPERGDAPAPGFLGVDVHSKTLGVVGYGRIGRAVARRAEGFGMRVLHTGRRDEGQPGWMPLVELLTQADIVTLHVPLDADTEGLLGRVELAAMKEGAVLVNMARGRVVDEGALIGALRDGPLAFAALDVTTVEPLPLGNPLLLLPNCLVTPHIGSATTETRTRMLRLAVENAVDMLEGRCPGGALNPEVLEC